MNELYTPHAADPSAIGPSGPMGVAQQLVAQWNLLQPAASNQPFDVRRLQHAIKSALEGCMVDLVQFQSSHGRLRTGAVDECLDATYVLERLEWCVLHNVPYIDRPRVSHAL